MGFVEPALGEPGVAEVAEAAPDSEFVLVVAQDGKSFFLACCGILPLVSALVNVGQVSLQDVIRRLTVEPARTFGLPYGTLAAGASADVVIFEPGLEWQVATDRFFSRGKNTPLAGHTLQGSVLMTLVAGELVYDAAEARV